MHLVRHILSQTFGSQAQNQLQEACIMYMTVHELQFKIKNIANAKYTGCPRINFLLGFGVLFCFPDISGPISPTEMFLYVRYT